MSVFDNKSLQKQLLEAQSEIARCKQEITELQQALDERTQEVNRLIQWLQNLQQDISAVYQSATWQIGDFIAKIILKILRRPVGVTTRDHINKIVNSFETWKINYFQSRRHIGFHNSYMPWHDTREYQLWIKEFDVLNQSDRIEIQTKITQFHYSPLMSICVLRESPFFEQTLESIKKQIYSKWEIFFISDKSDFFEKRGNEKELTANPVQYIENAENSLAENLNTAVDIAKGDFIILIESGDELSEDALYKIVESLNNQKDTDIIYSDEDKLDNTGQRYDPHFKSDWNRDLFYSQHFVQHLVAYRRTLIQEIGYFSSNYQGVEDYDCTLRMIEKIPESHIFHIPKVLYHCRSSSCNNAFNFKALALQAHFHRLKKSVNILPAIQGHTRIHYVLPSNPPLVSLIIPTRDKIDLLRGTVEGFLNRTEYTPIEIIIMDNGSNESDTLDYFKQIQEDNRVQIIRHDAPFNYSELNNIGVSRASGEIIGLMNNDLAVINTDWLTEMVGHALRPEVGAVGAKLYYANDTIQHAGVLVGVGGLAVHAFRFLGREAQGYHCKPFLTQNYSAVTAACLVLRREVFEKMGGFNEKNLKVAFNDVDLCLRIRKQGYKIVWTPYAELYHLESASRGTDNTLKKYLRLQSELKYMHSHWNQEIAYDPYYNPNLTIEYEDFSLAYPPRK